MKSRNAEHDKLLTPLRRVLQKLSRDEPVVGSVVTMNDHAASEMLAHCGFDFLWIDGEHSIPDRREVDRHILACHARGVAAFVRVPWTDPVLVKPIIDMGPAAIIFPFIRTPEDAKLAVASCRYPPDGVRGFGPRRANRYGSVPLEEYLQAARSEPWVIMQIEHVDCVNNLDQILDEAPVDSCVVGPMDLSASVDRLGQMQDPLVQELFDRAAQVCQNHKVPFGVCTGSGDQAMLERWRDRGVSWLALDADSGYIMSGARSTLDRVEALYGTAQNSESDS